MPYRRIDSFEFVRVPAVLDKLTFRFPELATFVKRGRSDWSRKAGENVIIEQKFLPGDHDRIIITAYGHPVATIYESSLINVELHAWPAEAGKMPSLVRWLRLHIEHDNTWLAQK